MNKKLKATAEALRAKTYKLNKPKWMPKNPYDGDIDIFQNIRLATRQGWGKGSIATAKAILEYLIATTDETKGYSHVITHTELKLMLKQLEAPNEK
jgi:hypothetical protein